MGTMTQAAREHRPVPRPTLRLVTSAPPKAAAAPTRRWKVIGLHALPGAFLGIIAEGVGTVIGFTFTQTLVLTAVPVVGSIVVALGTWVLRRVRSHDEEATAKLDEEYHADLRRQIRRLEQQVDDMARNRGRPLRGDEPPDGAA